MNRVLIVDDEVSVREALYDHLKQRGWEVLTADSGEHAIELLKTVRAQFIVLDEEMPDLSGLESAEAIREFEAHVPIVLMRRTGPPKLAASEETRIGPVKVLQKVSDLSVLGAKLEQCLKGMGQIPQESKRARPQKSGIRGRCLLIDDDAACRQMARLLLERHGIEVIEADCGEAGLKALDERPEAILLDVSMPGMDGLMTLRKIKAQAPEIPVIMVSAFGEEGTVTEAIRSGAYDYVKKPFSMEYLETVVLAKVVMGIKG